VSQLPREITFISKTVRLLWRCARHSDHIATITTDIPFGDTEAHSATETPDGFADVIRDVAQDERTQTLQFGLFVRGPVFCPEGGTSGFSRSAMGVEECFGFCGCKMFPRLSWLPAHRPMSVISPTVDGTCPSPTLIRYLSRTHHTPTPNPAGSYCMSQCSPWHNKIALGKEANGCPWIRLYKDAAKRSIYHESRSRCGDEQTVEKTSSLIDVSQAVKLQASM